MFQPFLKLTFFIRLLPMGDIPVRETEDIKARMGKRGTGIIEIKVTKGSCLLISVARVHILSVE